MKNAMYAIMISMIKKTKNYIVLDVDINAMKIALIIKVKNMKVNALYVKKEKLLMNPLLKKIIIKIKLLIIL